MLFLLLGAQAAAHPLLEFFSEEAKDAHREDLCVKANRLVIAKITTATSYEPTVQQRLAQRLPQFYTIATYTVERQVAVGDPASTFVLLQPGGQVNSKIAKFSGHPYPKLGSRWALALAYPQDDFTSQTPILIDFYPVPPNATLPSNQSINDAYTEYCNE